VKLSEIMRSAAEADPEEAREKIGELVDYLERNGSSLVRICGRPLAKELRPLLRRLGSVGSVLDIITQSDLENRS
jgi:hypothetical protein